MTDTETAEGLSGQQADAIAASAGGPTPEIERQSVVVHPPELSRSTAQFHYDESSVSDLKLNASLQLHQGVHQRIYGIRLIATGGLLVSLFYAALLGGLLAEDLYFTVYYNMLFALLYGILRRPITPERAEVRALLLLLCGVIHVAGSSFLFFPVASGNHYYLLLIPLFSLIIIEPRRVFWWRLYSLLGTVLVVWFELYRDVYIPPFVGSMQMLEHSGTRAFNMFIVLFLGGYVVRLFHRDLHVARKQLHVSYTRSERLLRNMLPKSIAGRLKNETSVIADSVEEASVLFADLVGFTAIAAERPARETVVMLNRVFSSFDELVVDRKLEKIKTIGDAYMVASGVPVARHDHVIQLVELAHDMLGVVDAYNAEMGTTLELRIGISSGPMIAGVIGSKKLSYDIWGDTVNVASRMESTGIPGRIQVTERVAESLRERFLFESRGEIQIKGRGKMETFLVTGQFDVDIDALSDEVSEPQTESH